jgi:nitrile hydratase
MMVRPMREGSVTASLSDHPHHQDHAHDRAHSDVPSDPALRTRALESLLAEKGLVDPAAIDAWVDAYEKKIGPRRGAQIVARAWTDAEFKTRLLQDATHAIEPFGFLGREAQHIVVVENTPTIHNLVVCTLCSCYPWGLLGLPPRWYKAAPYRARSVIDPRGVLAELGLVLGEDTEVRVWDSTAEIRYLVLPERPAGTDDLGEAQLAELVTRDAMIGVAKVVASKGRTA